MFLCVSASVFLVFFMFFLLAYFLASSRLVSLLLSLPFPACCFVCPFCPFWVSSLCKRQWGPGPHRPNEIASKLTFHHASGKIKS